SSPPPRSSPSTQTPSPTGWARTNGPQSLPNTNYNPRSQEQVLTYPQSLNNSRGMCSASSEASGRSWRRTWRDPLGKATSSSSALPTCPTTSTNSSERPLPTPRPVALGGKDLCPPGRLAGPGGSTKVTSTT